MRWTVRRICIFTVTFSLFFVAVIFCYEQFRDDSCVLAIPFWDFMDVYFSLPTFLPLRFLLLFTGRTSICIWAIPHSPLIRFSWTIYTFYFTCTYRNSVFFCDTFCTRYMICFLNVCLWWRQERDFTKLRTGAEVSNVTKNRTKNVGGGEGVREHP